jgi:uncharacterized protein YqgC (DUF456 family)
VSGQVWLDIIVGLVVLVGLVGAVIQVIPGSTLVGGAVLVWGLLTRGVPGWSAVAFAVLVTVGAQVVKYVLAGRYLKARGIPNRSLLVGGVLGVVGFFVIPVVGLFVGFVAGTFLAEWYRLRDRGPAWQATVVALKATGLTILLELFAALVVAAGWVVALVAVHT